MEHKKGNVVDILKFLQKDWPQEEVKSKLAMDFVHQYMHYILVVQFKGPHDKECEQYVKRLAEIAQDIAKCGAANKIKQIVQQMMMPIWKDVGVSLEYIQETLHTDFEFIELAQRIDNGG